MIPCITVSDDAEVIWTDARKRFAEDVEHRLKRRRPDFDAGPLVSAVCEFFHSASRSDGEAVTDGCSTLSDPVGYALHMSDVPWRMNGLQIRGLWVYEGSDYVGVWTLAVFEKGQYVVEDAIFNIWIWSALLDPVLPLKSA